MSDLRVGPTAIDAILAHANAGADQEVCGFLVGTRGPDGLEIRRAVAARNTATRAHANFEIHARELLELEDDLARGEQVVGLYHSHPGGPAVPSPADERLSVCWPGLIQAIVGREHGRWQRPRFYARPPSSDPRRAGLVESRVAGGALLSSAGS